MCANITVEWLENPRIWLKVSLPIRCFFNTKNLQTSLPYKVTSAVLERHNFIKLDTICVFPTNPYLRLEQTNQNLKRQICYTELYQGVNNLPICCFSFRLTKLREYSCESFLQCSVAVHHPIEEILFGIVEDVSFRHFAILFVLFL
ncbi:CLUMA_CG005606, isoform A [Clunio marinus]|uniref:CLUMA_CG005606, isoform A n=1 Tax=Clunio marinus TaxID=568069 RepID=A0A1J1HWW5_9DIPT|nr:CLUMA_CG005606, isoform A [Clunio marinus]